MSQRTLIDGYNLLHAAGLVRGKLVGRQLEGARLRLLQRISCQLTKEERAHTIVIFDAKALLPVTCREEFIEGIRVLYPEPGHEADELIEQLIGQDTQPRKLLIVSSDRRLHRAARERLATAINSDRYLDRLDERRTRPANEGSRETNPMRPAAPRPTPGVVPKSQTDRTPTLPAGDVDFWMKEFGEIELPPEADLDSVLRKLIVEPQTQEQPPAKKANDAAASSSHVSSAPSPAGLESSSARKPLTGSRQDLIVTLPSRPDLDRLPPRPKKPLSTVRITPEPADEPVSEKAVDADLERWKDVLQQVLDEEQKR